VKATPGLETEPGGWIIADEDTGQTTRRGVFAARGNTGESQLAEVAPVLTGHWRFWLVVTTCQTSLVLVVGGGARATEVATTNPHLGGSRADSPKYGRIKNSLDSRFLGGRWWMM
jgi:hypothetical protein